MNQKRLLAFLHYQRYLGLTDLDFSSARHVYGLHGTWFSYATQAIVVGIFSSALVAALAESLFYLDTQTETGRIFDNAVIIATSVSQLLANLWFRGRQQSQVTLLHRLSQLVSRLQVDTEALPHPRWFYRIWLVVCLFYAVMVTHFATNIWLTEMELSHMVTLLGFAFRCVLANFQITCYSCMVRILATLLRVQAEQLKGMVFADSSISREDLAQSLRVHDEILLLGQREVVEIYGGVLLFLFLYQVMECVLMFYISSLANFRTVRELMFILAWLSPMLFYLILPLAANDVLNQPPFAMDEFQSGELCAYYRLCRYLGIFCIDYNPSKKKYHLRRSAICYVVHFAIQIYLVGCMAVLVIYWGKSFKRELTQTGNHYDRLVMVLALGILLVQNAWLIWLQAPHLRIVRQIELYRRKQLGHLRLVLPKRLLWLIIATNLLYMANFIKTCVLDWLSEASHLFVITSLGFPLRYLVTSFTMGTYFCMVHIVRLVLGWNQSQIKAIVEQSGDPKQASVNLLRMRGCLELHDRLVLLCNVEISLVYGFIAWLSWMFASLDVTGVIYLAMVIQNTKPIGLKLLTNIVWLSPTLMTCAAGFMSNRVAFQVRRLHY